ncbi:hypothetical protein SAMN06295937_102310 [Sphingopyxis flava]|uniref:Uncharacterized protein n=1 Tax=Sphingopyxis flava TaxID=1507287 RepID=A0A1T5ELE6_9SPHN|nr:hypothetical protein SAMN06295937_102310 [Sphingopyxis flava]
MSHVCGDRPGSETALRALNRGDIAVLMAAIAGWPADIRVPIAHLLAP